MKKKNQPEKIFLEVEDDIDEALVMMEKVPGDLIILNIPKGSALGESVKGFRYLRKKARELGKILSVESVDDHILELAEVADIEAINPVFQSHGHGKTVQDIIPSDSSLAPEARGGSVSLRPVRIAPSHEEEKESDTEKPRESQESREDATEKFSFPAVSLPGFSRSTLRLAALGFILLVLGWVGIAVLPKATISLVLKRYPIPFMETVKADTKTPATSVVGETILLPGELLHATKNLEMSFPASGEENVEREATGKITIVNAFSSAPQPLVARTRFQTPDGKIFRLFDAVTVPGAKIASGKIEPSSIEAEVYADAAGEAGNIGPVEKFTIPGFQNDAARFKGFYARSTAPMKGGAKGFLPVPTEDDLVKAREKLKATLLGVLKSEVAILMSDSFDVLKDTTSFAVIREETTPPTSGEKTFSLFMEADLRQFVFKKDDLKNIIVSRARLSEDIPKDVEFDVHEFTLAYNDVAADLGAERVQFGVKGEVVFRARVDPQTLTGTLLGKSSEEVKKVIFGLPGLDRARVSLWPFWVNKVPQNEKKVKIVVE
ncbi:MAG: hypothetical protein Q8R20_00750 [Nanoarchaeota archaeon]|nr:hypothetical protein [Nanoarchaeota archaeon]